MSTHPTPDNPPPDDSGPSDAAQQQLELGDDQSAIALRKAWERTLRAMALKLNKPTFESFVRPLKPLSFDGNIVVLGAPSSFAREWAEKKYTQVLRGHLEQFLDIADLQVRFVIATPDVQPLLGEKPLPLQQAASPLGDLTRSVGAGTTEIAPAAAPGAADWKPLTPAGSNAFLMELAAAPLNEKYTFEHFVVGKSNQLAHAGALAVAEAPGATYNPLFLYGSPGLGKTHLMHAIGNHLHAALPQARVAYVSGETFTNHFVAALRDKRTEDFRRAYRSVDVWLIDDIQTIAMGQKEQTKEEFFHTFNTLHQMNRQIVIASDRPPRELRAMDERLRSRFMGGLVADISPPELEMRMAILQKKALLENLRIPDEVIAFMASLIQSNIRALEGALIKLMAYASLVRSPVTKQLASDVLSNYFVERTPPRPVVSAHPEDHEGGGDPGVGGAPIDHIIETVAVQLGIEKDMIVNGGSRNKAVMHARQLAMYFTRELTKVPLANLAPVFHCKNFTSIFHAHAKVQEALGTDAELRETVARIQRVIEYSL